MKDVILRREQPLKVGDLVKIIIPKKWCHRDFPSGIVEEMFDCQGKTARISKVYPATSLKTFNSYNLDIKMINDDGCEITRIAYENFYWNDGCLQLVEETDFDFDTNKAESLI